MLYILSLQQIFQKTKQKNTDSIKVAAGRVLRCQLANMTTKLSVSIKAYEKVFINKETDVPV